jgi:RNA polymerase sigma factor (sigma-70 family)
MAIDADTLMRHFIEADDANGEQPLTDLLSTYAEPQIRRIITQRLRAAGVSEHQDIDDLCGEVLAELLYRLRQIKENPAANPIDNFSSYAAAATYRAYSDYLRRKYPQRHRLKTQLRYLLQTDRRFDLRQLPDFLWMCGLSRWGDSIHRLRKIPTLEELNHLSAQLHTGRLPDHPADSVADVLNRMGAPVELNDLVGIMSELWGIRDRPAVDLEKTTLPDRRDPDAISRTVELQQWLGQLWREVGCLPIAQRHALLLNLREEGGGAALMLVPVAGIASIREIAKVLEIEHSELARLWKQLPIDDLTIAERLGVTRQQVINLRKSARARLTRRMAVL